jgi:hypothetical protein
MRKYVRHIAPNGTIVRVLGQGRRICQFQWPKDAFGELKPHSSRISEPAQLSNQFKQDRAAPETGIGETVRLRD